MRNKTEMEEMLERFMFRNDERVIRPDGQTLTLRDLAFLSQSQEDDHTSDLMSVDDCHIDMNVVSFVRSGELVLKPIHIVECREGFVVVTPNKTILCGRRQNVSRIYSPEKYYNVNSDGIVRDLFPEFVHVPIQGTQRQGHLSDVSRLAISENQVTHLGGMDVPEGIVSTHTSMFVDIQEGLAYDMLKRCKGHGYLGNVNPKASVIRVTDDICGGFWITRADFAKLLEVVPGKGYHVFRIKSNQYGIKDLFLNHELVLDDDTVEGDASAQVVVKTSKALHDPFAKNIQMYISLSHMTPLIFEGEMNTLKRHMNYSQQAFEVDLSHEQKKTAVDMGRRVEELCQGMNYMAELSAMCSDLNQFLLLGQVLRNKAAVLVGDYVGWRTIDYSRYNWEKMLEFRGDGSLSVLYYVFQRLREGVDFDNLARKYSFGLVQCFVDAGYVAVLNGKITMEGAHQFGLLRYEYPLFGIQFILGAVLQNFDSYEYLEKYGFQKSLLTLKRLENRGDLSLMETRVCPINRRNLYGVLSSLSGV